MINLQGASEKIQLVSSAAGSLDVLSSWANWDNTTQSGENPDGSSAAITTATTTDIVAAPGAGKTRNVKLISVRNKSASASNTVTVQRVDATRTVEIFKTPLLQNEQLIISDAGVPFVYDAFGGVKNAGTPAIDPSINDFRLSGVSATAVMTADSTSLSTIYLAQYKGNRIALYDGTNWQLLTPLSEISLAVSGRTTDLPFDIFGFINAGVVALEFTNWTNATTRATGLTRVDGIWTKTGDPTRRYLGSCRARSATTFHWVRAGVDLPAKLDLFNANNRVEVNWSVVSLTNTWTYTLATWRQAQGSANYQCDVMVGLQEENFGATVAVSSRNATISIPRHVGIGFDSTTAISGITSATANTVASIESDQWGRVINQPTIGRHFYAWLEISTATGTCTWVGDDGALRLQSGMMGEWTC